MDRKTLKGLFCGAALACGLLLLTGCPSWITQYVRADRATYDTVAREYVDYVNNDPNLTEANQDARRAVVEAWLARLRRAEQWLP